MTVSFTPLKTSQTQKSGDTLPTQGNNTIANHSSTSPYTVPAGADYVLVSSNQAFTMTATPLADEGGQEITGYSVRFENAGEVEVVNVIPGKTVITVS